MRQTYLAIVYVSVAGVFSGALEQKTKRTPTPVRGSARGKKYMANMTVFRPPTTSRIIKHIRESLHY